METVSTGSMLAPAAALVLWTLIMLGWMAGTRLPAMKAMGGDLASAPPGGRGQDLDGRVPPSVSWKAHNLTHLHEQPTLFYATVAVLAILGAVTPLTVGLAWLYVGLRVVHSIYQATVNIVRVRFMLFMASTIVLAILAVIALIAALSA